MRHKNNHTTAPRSGSPSAEYKSTATDNGVIRWEANRSPAATKMAFSHSSEFPGQRAGSRSGNTTYVPVQNGTEQKGQSCYGSHARSGYMLKSKVRDPGR